MIKLSFNCNYLIKSCVRLCNYIYIYIYIYIYSILNDNFCGMTISLYGVSSLKLFQDQTQKYFWPTSVPTKPTPGILIFSVYSFFFTTVLNTLMSYNLWNSEFSHMVKELTQRSSKTSIYASTW